MSRSVALASALAIATLPGCAVIMAYHGETPQACPSLQGSNLRGLPRSRVLTECGAPRATVAHALGSKDLYVVEVPDPGRWDLAFAYLVADAFSAFLAELYLVPHELFVRDKERHYWFRVVYDSEDKVEDYSSTGLRKGAPDVRRSMRRGDRLFSQRLWSQR